MAKKPDPKHMNAVAAAAAKHKPKPSPDKLQALRNKIAEARDLELRIVDAQAQLQKMNEDLSKILNDELPDLFQTVGFTSMTIDKSGNEPAYEAELQTVYRAGLPKDERRAQALKKFKWLSELTKKSYTIDFGKGDDAKAKKFEKLLKSAKVDYDVDVNVHWKTLTSEIRRRFEAGQPLPPADLNLLGAFVGTNVKLTRKKD